MDDLRIRLANARWTTLGERLLQASPHDFEQLELRISALVEQLEAERVARARLDRAATDFGLLNRMR